MPEFDIHERKFVFQVHPNPSDFGYVINIGMDKINTEGCWYIGQPIIFKRSVDGGMIEAPTLQLTKKQLVDLMDELWRAGIRPSNGEGNIGQIGALKDHLDDLRRIIHELTPFRVVPEEVKKDADE